MVDGVSIQAKAYKGFGKAAKVLGLPFAVWRWTNGALVDTGAVLPAQFVLSATDAGFMRTPKMKDYAYQALIDGRAVQVGDVLISATAGTYFIQAKMPLLPIMAVRCNAVVKIMRPKAASQAAIGHVRYSGVYPTVEEPERFQTLFAGVPCALVLEGIGAGRPFGMLPGDTPGYMKFFAHVPGFVPQGAVSDRDMVEDQNGETYQIAVAQWTQANYALELTQQQS